MQLLFISPIFSILQNLPLLPSMSAAAGMADAAKNWFAVIAAGRLYILSSAAESAAPLREVNCNIAAERRRLRPPFPGITHTDLSVVRVSHGFLIW